MKRSIFVVLIVCSFIAASNYSMAATINLLAGDKDFGEDRNSNDIQTNMDFFVFEKNIFGGYSDPADNDKGLISWSYALPAGTGWITSGSMTIRAFDVDFSENMELFYSYNGGTFVKAGDIQSLPIDNLVQWNNYTEAVIPDPGSAVNIDAWTMTTLNFSTDLLTAINSTQGSNLYFQVRNNNQDEQNWGAVIDYADITLNHNPVPEPASMLLFGTGITCLLGMRRRKLQK